MTEDHVRWAVNCLFVLAVCVLNLVGVGPAGVAAGYVFLAIIVCWNLKAIEEANQADAEREEIRARIIQ